MPSAKWRITSILFHSQRHLVVASMVAWHSMKYSSSIEYLTRIKSRVILPKAKRREMAQWCLQIQGYGRTLWTFPIISEIMIPRSCHLHWSAASIGNRCCTSKPNRNTSIWYFGFLRVNMHNIVPLAKANQCSQTIWNINIIKINNSMLRFIVREQQLAICCCQAQKEHVKIHSKLEAKSHQAHMQFLLAQCPQAHQSHPSHGPALAQPRRFHQLVGPPECIWSQCCWKYCFDHAPVCSSPLNCHHVNTRMPVYKRMHYSWDSNFCKYQLLLLAPYDTVASETKKA